MMLRDRRKSCDLCNGVDNKLTSIWIKSFNSGVGVGLVGYLKSERVRRDNKALGGCRLSAIGLNHPPKVAKGQNTT